MVLPTFVDPLLDLIMSVFFNITRVLNQLRRKDFTNFFLGFVYDSGVATWPPRLPFVSS